MFKKLKELFSGAPEPPVVKEVNADEVELWLEGLKDKCLSERTNGMDDSREIILTARDNMLTLIHEFGEETVDDTLRHPKVEQVNRLALPDFTKRMENELSITFSDDDEKFYTEVAGLIQGVFKIWRGPGRYLHILYAEEVKLLKENLDNIGRELNHLTDIMKISRERISEIDECSDSLTKCSDLKIEINTLITRLQDISVETAEKERESLSKEDEFSSFKRSNDYIKYLNSLEALKGLEEKANTTKEAVDALVRTALPIWRKASRYFQESGDDKNNKSISDLIKIAANHEYDNAEISTLIENTASSVFSIISDGTIPVKNAFEKALFTTTEEYTRRFKKSIEDYNSSALVLLDSKEKTIEDPVVKRFKEIERAIEEISRDITRLKDESGKSLERKEALLKEYDGVFEKATKKVTDLSNGEKKLKISDIYEN